MSGVRIFLWLILGAAVGVFALTFVHATLYQPGGSGGEGPAPAGAPVSVSPTSTPTRIRIASLGIDANIQSVGLTKTGAMGTPNNYTDVGWYKYGPMPGQVGSALLDGHVDNGLSLPGVFKRLSEIQIGDEIEVVNSAGQAVQFFVRGIENYPYQSVPIEAIFNRRDAAHLVLITCDGIWVPSGKTYDRRLVVFADLR